MTSINKIRISSTDYDVSFPAAGVLETDSSKGSGNYFYSNDEADSSATSYTSVDKINATDTNSTIFSKLTSMIKNVRFINNRFGSAVISSIASTITAAISTVNSSINGKAAAVHSHTVTDLPVSNTQVNSNEYIPTSALIYSMNTKLETAKSSTLINKNFTTNITAGGIPSGTSITSDMKLRTILKNMLYSA